MLFSNRLQRGNYGFFSAAFTATLESNRFIFGATPNNTRSEYQRWNGKQRVKKILLRSTILGVLYLRYRDRLTRPAIDERLHNLRLLAHKVDDKIDKLNEGLDDLKDTVVRSVKYLLSNGRLSESDPRIKQKLNGSPWKLIKRQELPLLPDRNDLDFPPNLPTLILDLDNVLAKVQYNRLYGWRVIKRPFAQNLLKDLLFHYEIVIWSKFEYPIAQSLVTQWGIPVMGTLHKEHCDKGPGGNYVKNLSKLGRDLSRIVVVDSDPSALENYPDNLVLVEPFDGKLPSNDNELEILHDYLKELSTKSGDLRPIINQSGRLKQQRREAVELVKHRDRYNALLRNFAQSILGQK